MFQVTSVMSNCMEIMRDFDKIYILKNQISILNPTAEKTESRRKTRYIWTNKCLKGPALRGHGDSNVCNLPPSVSREVVTN